VAATLLSTSDNIITRHESDTYSSHFEFRESVSLLFFSYVGMKVRTYVCLQI
jgi:hypothetical protein